MRITTILKVLKPVTSLVSSTSTGVVIGNVIKATTPSDLNKYQSFMVKAGSFFVGGAVGAVVAERVEKQFDLLIKAVDTGTDLVSHAKSMNSATYGEDETVNVATILKDLSPEDRAELERLIEHGFGKADD